jgi:murein DD-endopeptidase MepM/ murein hydrolase activator NlpD
VSLVLKNKNMKLNLKHRHVLTSAGNIRLRIVCVALLLLSVVGLFFVVDDGDEKELATAKKLSIVTPSEAIEKPVVTIAWGDYDPEISGQGIAPFLSRMGKRPYFDKPYQWFKTITVKSGDVLGVLMEDTGLKGEDYVSAMRAIKSYVAPNAIKPGHDIIVTNERLGTVDTIAKIDYIFDSLKSVSVVRIDGKWTASEVERPTEIKTHAVRTTIENSIYGSLGKQDVPDGIINRMIKAYSWSVDFQRDIWGGEEIEMLYETRETDDGEYVRSNRLLYANLKLRNKDMPIYIFEKDKGFPKYFEPSGQSIRRALMKTPIDGARLSSGYGMRTHPVLGYRKAHRGVDFAAPTGTPIYAAGDGVVERANRFSSFGNYIRIRHNETYKTAYAHLNGFAKGVRAGTRVKQGQVIGYVGTTGRSTGPHLHYEVHKNGKKVNPHSIDLPIGEKLKGTAMANFKNVVSKRDAEFQKLLK